MHVRIRKWIFIILCLQSITAQYEYDYYDDAFDYELMDSYYKSVVKIEVTDTEISCSKCGTNSFTRSKKDGNPKGPLVPAHKYPWVVKVKIPGEQRVRNCGGTLISATFVLTAAHCLFKAEKKNEPSCLARQVHSSCFKKAEDISVSLMGSAFYLPMKPIKVIAHPNYNFHWNTFDIALIQLPAPMQCSEKIMTICLPTKNLEKIGHPLITTEFGASIPRDTEGNPRLKEGLMHVVNPRMCWEPYQPGDIHHAVTCAISDKDRKLPCHGATGSSIFGRFGEKFYAVAVTSKANRSPCDTPRSFAKVYYFMGWIKSIVRDLPPA